MKRPMIFSVSLLATMITISPLALSADGNETDRTYQGVQPKESVPTKMTPHSHVEEKLHIRLPQAEASEQSNEASRAAASKAGDDKAKHYHPRDAK